MERPATAPAVPVLDPGTLAALDVTVALLLLVVAAVGALVVRRALLVAGRGAFDCRFREVPAPGGAERPAADAPDGPAEARAQGRLRAGVARCGPARLTLHPVLSWRWWPASSLDREKLAVVDRRPLPAAPGRRPDVVLTCSAGGRVVELEMAEQAAGAFGVWAEAGPPGRGGDLA